MIFESRQKETLRPLNRKRLRKGSQGQRNEHGVILPLCQIKLLDFSSSQMTVA